MLHMSTIMPEASAESSHFRRFDRFTATSNKQLQPNGDNLLVDFPSERRVNADRAMRIPRRSKISRPDSPSSDKHEFTASPLRRTASLPKRTIWKDKGGTARYILREEHQLKEAKQIGKVDACREAVTNAILSGSVASLAVLETVETAAVVTKSVAAATRMGLQRSFSQKRMLSGKSERVSAGQDNETEATEEDMPVRCGRSLLQQTESLTSSGELCAMQRSLLERARKPQAAKMNTMFAA